MNIICCCRKINRVKKDNLLVNHIDDKNRTCNIFDSSKANKTNDRTCNDIITNITRTNSILSTKSIDNQSNVSDFSSDTISICSNSSLNDYIIALDSIMTRQEYMNHQAPVCGHEIEQLIFNTNLL